MTSRLHPEAEEEMLGALEWYGAEQPDLARDLQQRLLEAFARIGTNPLRSPPYIYGTRRYLLRRFPYAVVYSVEDENTVFVLAIAHQRRSPGYWRTRLA